MLKKILLKKISELQNSQVTLITLLKEFLKKPKIAQLHDTDNISFSRFLTFLQKHASNYLDLFKEPNLSEDSNEARLLHSFLNAEKQKSPIIPHSHLIYKLNELSNVEEAASAIAIIPGSMITSTCYYDIEENRVKGKIVQRDPSGQFIKTLVKEPASAIAILPNGNMITSTCYFDEEENRVKGKIVLRDSSGVYIQTLAKEPASAIAILPDGRMITGTCYYDSDDDCPKGQIVLRDQFGKCIRSLVEEPASSIMVLPDENMITSTCYYDEVDDSAKGKIVMRDASGKYISTLVKEPASAFIVSKDGNMIISTCYYDQDEECVEGKISFNSPELTTTKIPKYPQYQATLPQRIDDLLNERSKLASIQFHKGISESEKGASILCKLPPEILDMIYAYIFSDAKEKNYAISNPKCFPYPGKNVKEIYVSQIIQDKASRLKFFKKSIVSNDKKEILLTETIEKKVSSSNLFSQTTSNCTPDVKKNKKNHKHKKCTIM